MAILEHSAIDSALMVDLFTPAQIDELCNASGRALPSREAGCSRNLAPHGALAGECSSLRESAGPPTGGRVPSTYAKS